MRRRARFACQCRLVGRAVPLHSAIHLTPHILITQPHASVQMLFYVLLSPVTVGMPVVIGCNSRAPFARPRHLLAVRFVVPCIFIERDLFCVLLLLRQLQVGMSTRCYLQWR